MVKKALLLARGASPVVLGDDRSQRSSLVSLPVINRPLLEHHLECLSADGIDRIAIVCDRDARSEVDRCIESQSSRYVHLQMFDRDPTDSLASVMFGAREFLGTDPFVLHLGDSLVRCDLAQLASPGWEGEHDSITLVRTTTESPSAAVGALPIRAMRSSRHAGIYIMGTGFVRAIAQGEPQDIEEEIDAALGLMSRSGGRQETIEVDSWRWAPGRESLLRANRFALEGLERSVNDSSLDNATLEGPVSVHPSARIRNTLVRGPAIIGSGARITDSYIGPYSAIGGEVEVVGAEVENSVVLIGASIRHIGTRLDASVIGPGARITREFSIPKAMRLEVGPSAEITLS